MTMVSEILAQPGDRIAVAAGNREVSYSELAADVHRACAFLVERKLAGRTIGIHLGPQQGEHDYSTWVAHLAALRIGATHISILNAAMLDRVLRIAKVDALVGRLPEGSTSSNPSVVPFDLAAITEADASKDNEAEAVRLSLTSGTTGEPKLVRWDAAEMEERVAQASEVGGIGPDSRVGSMLGLRTTAGFRYPIATWRAGGRVLLSNRLRASDGRPQVTRSTLLVCSPFQLQILSGGKPWPGKEERTIAVLGGRVPAPLRQWALANLASKILVSYGSTETGNIAHGDAALADRHPGAVGHVREGLELRIVGEDGKPVPAGQTGRVQVRAASAPGDKRRKPAWSEPGDLGVIYEDGLLAIDGRDADVLNVAGVKIVAGDVEAKLTAIDGVSDAGVTVFDAGDREVLAVALVASEDRQLQQLVGAVSPLIPRGAEYRMFFVPAIPRNEMGKIDRPQLVETVNVLLKPATAKNTVDA